MDWGSALGGIRLDLATAAMLDLAHERKPPRTGGRSCCVCRRGLWVSDKRALPSARRGRRATKPAFSDDGGRLLITKNSEDDAVFRNTEHEQRQDHQASVVRVAAQEGRGLCVVAEIEEGVLSRDRGLSRRVSGARESWRRVSRTPTCAGSRTCSWRRSTGPHVRDQGWVRRARTEHGSARLAPAQPCGFDDGGETRTTRGETRRDAGGDGVRVHGGGEAVLLCLDPHAFPGSDERVSGLWTCGGSCTTAACS